MLRCAFVGPMQQTSMVQTCCRSITYYAMIDICEQDHKLV